MQKYIPKKAKNMIQHTHKQLENVLKDDDLSFVYLGKFDNMILAFVTQLIQKHVEVQTGIEKKRNKLSFLMAESFQNILRYGILGRAEDCDNGEIFVVRHIGQTMFILTGNYIENENIPAIKEKLDRVNNLDTEDLKKLYVEILTNKKLSSRGGAGLGFVEMVRKSGEKLDYKFEKLDDKRSFFYLQIKIKDNEELACDNIDINQAKQLKEIMQNSAKYMALKGIINEKTISPLLSVSNENFRQESQNLQKGKAYHILVEMLQNIAKHAYKEDGFSKGLFTIGIEEDLYSISSCNKVSENQANTLENYLNKLKNMDFEQLDKYYKKILREGHQDLKIESGLGLIDIFRSSKEKQYFIDDLLNQKLFTITTKI